MSGPAESQMHQMSIVQLIEQAAGLAKSAGNSESAQVNEVRARVCLDIAQIKLMQSDQALKVQQIDLAREVNALTEKLLKSNEDASKQNEENAKSMNRATEELAKSTGSLKWATWALVAFTAVQALIALAALFKK
jgi:hypothetical protein